MAKKISRNRKIKINEEGTQWYMKYESKQNFEVVAVHFKSTIA